MMLIFVSKSDDGLFAVALFGSNAPSGSQRQASSSRVPGNNPALTMERRSRSVPGHNTCFRPIMRRVTHSQHESLMQECLRMRSDKEGTSARESQICFLCRRSQVES